MVLKLQTKKVCLSGFIRPRTLWKVYEKQGFKVLGMLDVDLDEYAPEAAT